MYFHLVMAVCQWWHWMKQARSESLGADQHWDLVKWSLVTLCSTGEMEPPLTPLTQCLALVQPHTPSSTSMLVQCMKWELHQRALLDWVNTVVEVGSKWQLTTVSEHQNSCSTNCLSIVVHYFTHQSKLITQLLIQFNLYSWSLVPVFLGWVVLLYECQEVMTYNNECTVQVCKLNAFVEYNDKDGSYHKLLIAEKEEQLHSCFVYTKCCKVTTCEAQKIAWC